MRFFLSSYIVSAVTLLCLGFAVVPVRAEGDQTGAPAQQAMIFQQNNVFAESSGLDEYESDPRFMVALVIQVVSSMLGIALVCYAVYGGYIMMLANGDSEQIGMGKKAIYRSMIGAVIIMSAYSVSRFIGAEFQRTVLPDAKNGGYTTPQDDGEPQLSDPFYERDNNFCTGVTCDENGTSTRIFGNSQGDGTDVFFEVN
jgi:hypothetical protein